jgi:hypothetical protein
MMMLNFRSLCEVKGQLEKQSEARYKTEWGRVDTDTKQALIRE